MIKIIVENEELIFDDNDSCNCTGSAEFTIPDGAVCLDAVFTFSKALEFASYMKGTIRNSFEEVADNLSDDIELDYRAARSRGERQ